MHLITNYLLAKRLKYNFFCKFKNIFRITKPNLHSCTICTYLCVSYIYQKKVSARLVDYTKLDHKIGPTCN